MKFLNKLLVGSLMCGALVALSVPAMAIPINGTATFTGVFTLTTGGVLSFCAPVTPTQTPCPASPTGPPGWNVPGSGTGDLTANGSDAAGGTISTLSSVTNPVGVTLGSPTLFVTFAGPPNDISFYMSTLFAGVGDPTCSSLTCTPPGSSVTFLNGSGGNSSATITMQGFARHASDAGSGFALASPLQMVFTAQFNQPYATVISNFQTAGSLTSTYSANFTATAIPEPMTLSMLGLGLVAFGIFRRRAVR
jgi:hypothetical protein